MIKNRATLCAHISEKESQRGADEKCEGNIEKLNRICNKTINASHCQCFPLSRLNNNRFFIISVWCRKYVLITFFSGAETIFLPFFKTTRETIRYQANACL
jgi:hypothetical protein